MSFYGGQGRPNDGNGSQLNAEAQDFMPRGKELHDDSRSLNRRNDRDGSSNLNA
jgi:hypothetical protein